MILLKKFALFFFDLIDKYFHQKKILGYLVKNLEFINLYIDVGSHKGTYTDLILKNFKVRKIFMFEPQKKIFKFIKKKYKNDKEVFMFNNAVSNKKKSQKIYINKHDLTSSLVKLDKNNRYLNLKAKLFGGSINKMINDEYKINCVTLDDVLKKKKIKYTDLIKIDTEGHELQVLLGLNKNISKIRYILIEFHNSNIYINYSSRKVHNYLIRSNFELQKVFKFPFTTWEDRIYLNRKFNEYSRISS